MPSIDIYSSEFDFLQIISLFYLDGETYL
jgi:hypothetical protein